LSREKKESERENLAGSVQDGFPVSRGAQRPGAQFFCANAR
jgi:hypothetical protein